MFVQQPSRTRRRLHRTPQPTVICSREALDTLFLFSIIVLDSVGKDWFYHSYRGHRHRCSHRRAMGEGAPWEEGVARFSAWHSGTSVGIWPPLDVVFRGGRSGAGLPSSVLLGLWWIVDLWTHKRDHGSASHSGMVWCLARGLSAGIHIVDLGKSEPLSPGKIITPTALL